MLKRVLHSVCLSLHLIVCASCNSSNFALCIIFDLKLICFIQFCKSIFRVQDDTWDFWYNLCHAWKCLEMYLIFFLFLFFVSIILNSNALCDALTVQIHYIVLLKNNEIFYLMLGIIFRSFKEGEHHSWLYFDYFLSYLPTYDEIHC